MPPIHLRAVARRPRVLRRPHPWPYRDPTKQTYGFFQQNLVSEYTYPQSVADGVNVDFEVYRIVSKISEQGSTIEAGTTVPNKTAAPANNA